MSAENQPATRTRNGQILEFLRRNLFRVRLDDGQEVTATMPENLFHVWTFAEQARHSAPVNVNVRLRKPPRIHRITHAWQVFIVAPPAPQF
jgi:hypothetical protein